MNEFKETVAIHEGKKIIINYVESLEESIRYFLKNEKFVSCINGRKNKVCYNLKECNEFFKSI